MEIKVNNTKCKEKLTWLCFSVTSLCCSASCRSELSLSLNLIRSSPCLWLCLRLLWLASSSRPRENKELWTPTSSLWSWANVKDSLTPSGTWRENDNRLESDHRPPSCEISHHSGCRFTIYLHPRLTLHWASWLRWAISLSVHSVVFCPSISWYSSWAFKQNKLRVWAPSQIKVSSHTGCSPTT